MLATCSTAKTRKTTPTFAPVDAKLIGRLSVLAARRAPSDTVDDTDIRRTVPQWGPSLRALFGPRTG